MSPFISVRLKKKVSLVNLNRKQKKHFYKLLIDDTKKCLI